MATSSRDLPVTIRLALAAVRVVSLIVPRKDRAAWRQEWSSEILHAHQSHITHRPSNVLSWGSDMSLLRRSFGSLADAAWLRRQFTRDSDLLHDLRHGARVMRRQPGFSLLAVVVLALGIGSTTAVLGVTDALLLRPLPFPNERELVAIWQVDREDPAGARGDVAPGNFLDWQERQRSFAAIAAVEPYSLDYTGGDQPEVFFTSLATEGFFEVLGATPLHGRLFRPDDHVPGGNQVVVLDYPTWQQRFDRDPAIVGQSIPLDGNPYTVVGILPEDFTLDLLESPERRGIWAPKVFRDFERNRRGEGWWAVIGRLAPGVALTEAQADLARVSADLGEAYPATNATTAARAEPLRDHRAGNLRPALALFLAAVIAVLLIACANVANMMLARAADRDREFAVRSSLGAGRGRLVRQLLAETGLIAIAGTAAGVGLALWLVEFVGVIAPPDLDQLRTVQLDWRLVGFAAAAGIAATLLAGLLPALQFSRARRPEALGASRGGTGTRSSRIVGDGLAVAEIALAVVLVLSAGLLLRSFGRLVAVNPGFATERVLALQVFAWDRGNADEDRRRLFFQETVEDLRRLPGVTDAGAVSAMPLISANIDVQASIVVDGRTPPPDGQEDLASVTMITPGYFSAMGVETLNGRGIEATDTASSEPVIVVTESLGRRYWPDRSPINGHVTFSVMGDARRARVVGVVGDLRHDGLDRPAREEIFVPHTQAPFGSMTYVLRTAGDADAVITSAQQAIWNHDPLLTFYETKTVQELVAASVAPQRFSLLLVGLFASVAMLLAVAGIYGVLSFTTERRLPEFGMRVALGATSRDLGRLVIGRGLRLGFAGLAIGLGLAVIVGRAVQSVLFEVSALDPVTLAAVSVFVLLLSSAACYVPARRAMRVDPIAALRD